MIRRLLCSLAYHRRLTATVEHGHGVGIESDAFELRTIDSMVPKSPSSMALGKGISPLPQQTQTIDGIEMVKFNAETTDPKEHIAILERFWLDIDQQQPPQNRNKSTKCVNKNF